MSMISEQVDELKCAAEMAESDGSMVYAQILREAANTIEEQAAKLHAANMERSTAYYNGGWIPCSERLPEENGFYLTTVRYKDNNVTFVEKKVFGTKRGWDITQWYEVTAWMPLPEPYKEVNDD